MRRRQTTGVWDRQCTLALGVVASCALALSACGSSGSSNNGSSSSREAAGLKFADCMRSHGVPNFPDPSAGGGIQMTPGSGIDPQSPAFQAAQNACMKLMPSGGPAGGHGSESRRLALLKLAQCMRRHGISTFPDPTDSPPPSAPPAGGGLAFGDPGALISVPQSLIESPGFKQAGAACGFPGLGPPPRGAKRSITALPG
jgi:hypothetical protein